MTGETPRAELPRFEAPEVAPPQRTIPGSLGCLAAFALALAAVGLIIAHFYSVSDYTTSLNVDGVTYFSGSFARAETVLLTERYKLTIRNASGQELTLPPAPSPVVNGRAVFADLAPGAGVDGDLMVKEGFLKDLTLRIDGRAWHYDADAGWTEVAAGK